MHICDVFMYVPLCIMYIGLYMPCIFICECLCTYMCSSICLIYICEYVHIDICIYLFNQLFTHLPI